MAAGAGVGENQLQRIIRDLQEAVAELAKEYRESGEPITDDNTNLHKFSYKLEYLLQFDQKEKTTFLGTRKDYWDYFSDCLSKIKGANDGIRFVKSIPELKTSLGKGRAFIRYSLVHQRLADTLQQCVMNQRLTSDWYYARSPFLKPHLSVDIITHLYELNEVHFDVVSRGHDLDASWPTFARTTLGMSSSPSHTWKPPSRSSSINSLASSYSQQAHEFPSSPDFGQGLLAELNESLPAGGEDLSAVEDLQLELDQSELKQRELLDRVRQLGEEAGELRGVVVELQRQLDVSLAAQEEQQNLQGALSALEGREKVLSRELQTLRVVERAREAEQRVLQDKLAVAEGKNAEVLASLDAVLCEKGQQATSYFDSAQKIHKLLDRLKELERGKIEAVAESQENKRQIERLEDELRVKETAAKEGAEKLRAQLESAGEAKAMLDARMEEQHSENDKLQGALNTREKEVFDLQKQLQDLQRSLEEKKKQVDDGRRVVQEDREEIQRNTSGLKKTLETEAAEAIERLTSEKKVMEKSQLERSSLQAKQQQELSEKLALVEGQLEVNMKEVQRLQAEVLDHRVQLQWSGEENLRKQVQLEVTEAQKDELRTLTEQLKAQMEALNQGHVAELLQCKQNEEALVEARDREASARAELSAAAQVELSRLKAENERLAHENGETQEGLHRANTEMAELGMTICELTAEREEARERWAQEAARIGELEECTTREVGRLEAGVVALRQENASLKVELAEMETLSGMTLELQSKLEMAENQVKTFQNSSQEEIEAIKFQMSSESMSHENQMKRVNEELMRVKAQLQTELENVSGLEAKVSELQVVNEEYSKLIGQKDATIRQSKEEIQQLKDSFSSAEDALSAMQKVREELKQKLDLEEADKRSQHLKMSAEIDDLSRTKSNLEERLIELIKDKDALWQKSDALEFEQKLRAEERWWLVDKEATHCLDCQSQFTWWLRRHHCRLCGRIFCYYCSNNFVMTKHSGKKERCCRECYNQHLAVVERFTQAELIPSDTQPPPPGAGPESPQRAPYKPTPRVTVSEPSSRSDDAVFDIITEEEVNGIYDSDAMSQGTGDSLKGERDRGPPGPHQDTDMTPDDLEEHVATLQDSETNLLKSGEVTVAVPLSINEITQFGDASRELFIKSSCYSLITIAMDDRGPTLSWMFSSEPKSISFSVVYRETQDTPVEQSKVLIPLTRCNAHKETIHGQLKVRSPGLYALVFDNSFSRFISKKVFYHLTIEKPVIYDGSDLNHE